MVYNTTITAPDVSMENYEVYSVCFEPWAEKIRSYWKYLGGDECYVLLGFANGHVLLIPKLDPDTGKIVHGILLSEPTTIPCFRNLLWHEMGHLRGLTSDDPTAGEFHADEWAIESALKKGFVRIAEEVVVRCSSYISDESISSVYKDAAKMILIRFNDFAQSIVDKYNTSKGN